MDNSAKIIYFQNTNGEKPVYIFINSLEFNQKAKIFRIFQQIQEYGLQAIIPHIKKLAGSPLWEIRILGKDNIRILYVTVEQKSVLLLHGFIKKKQKTPPREINLALKRLSLMKITH